MCVYMCIYIYIHIHIYIYIYVYIYIVRFFSGGLRPPRTLPFVVGGGFATPHTPANIRPAGPSRGGGGFAPPPPDTPTPG